MSCWVLVPIKTREACKSRLADSLSQQQRLLLVEEMLQHVLAVLESTEGIDQIAVVSEGAQGVPDSVLMLPDRQLDLNTSLNDAVDVAREQGADRIIVIPADLPYLHSSDVKALLGSADGREVLIAPDDAESGTNAISFPVEQPLQMVFGAHSFAAFSDQVDSPVIVHRSGLAFDLDTPADLQRYRQFQRARARAESCLQRPLQELMTEAQALTLEGFDRLVTYSRKVFIPLTHLCRDVCHYCTFAKTPNSLDKPYLPIEEVLEIVKAGAKAGCKEALFTLGDKPELRYRAAREALAEMNCETTLDYVEKAAKAVFEETGLLPHLNPGLMTREEMMRLRKVSASMGIMLETASERLSEKGMPHYGSPDKLPAARLHTLKLAGELQIPMTTGLLIGIGESRQERIDSLLAIYDLHQQYGHIQEVIIQNFRAKDGTKMVDAPEPSLDEHLWTIAMARHLFGPEMSIQAPPNLQPEVLQQLILAGVNDWGGVSPITPDHVNPERPWPQLERLEQETADAGRQLAQRLAIAPGYVLDCQRWLDPALVSSVLRLSDSNGLAREDGWYAGAGSSIPQWFAPAPVSMVEGNITTIPRSGGVAQLLARVESGSELSEAEIVRLFSVRGSALQDVLAAADQLRQQAVGDVVTYAINRNINYTNICTYRCGFCAFAKGQGGKEARALRGPAYLLDTDEIVRRSLEAWEAGATEVCLQGGIHPTFTGNTYLGIVQAVKSALPDMHIHAFSPLEISHGASTLGMTLKDYLLMLKDAGLATLPGTAAEILHDDVRQIISPDKPNTAEWLEVIGTAHRVGINTTATIMFGHVDRPQHWAAHLLHIRRLQQETGGFTEFVPLPYVHMEAPLWRKGLSRSGPTFRESVLMHAVSRLVLHPLIKNIQTSWVKMGREGAGICLQSGANDLGGTLMNESITRAAGGVNGQEMGYSEMTHLIDYLGRTPQQRTTLYRPVSDQYETAAVRQHKVT